MAQHALDRRADVAHGALCVEHDEDVRAVLDKRAEVFFAQAYGLLIQLALHLRGLEARRQ